MPSTPFETAPCVLNMGDVGETGALGYSPENVGDVGETGGEVNACGECCCMCGWWW